MEFGIDDYKLKIFTKLLVYFINQMNKYEVDNQRFWLQ